MGYGRQPKNTGELADLIEAKTAMIRSREYRGARMIFIERFSAESSRTQGFRPLSHDEVIAETVRIPVPRELAIKWCASRGSANGSYCMLADDLPEWVRKLYADFIAGLTAYLGAHIHDE